MSFIKSTSRNAANSTDLPPTVSQARFHAPKYDLAGTLNSGQAFRWSPFHDSWQGIIGHQWVRLQQVSEVISAWTWPPAANWDWLVHYLQLNLDFPAVLASFPPQDPQLAAAVNACNGLRLLRQDPWECLASFLLSSTKQIVQIRQIVEILCQRHGQPLPPCPGLRRLWAFPRPETIAALSEQELRSCKMGFRAPSLLAVARRIADHRLVLDDLAKLSTAEARQVLLDLPGVGEKIADCVLLFAYGAPDAFPMDVWILKALRELYFHGRLARRSELAEFVGSHFGPHAGYAQQYLFHYMRIHLGRRTRQSLSDL